MERWYRFGGRKRPIDILFNLDHPDGPPINDTEITADEESPVAEDDEQGDDSENDEGEEASGSALQEQLKRRTFVVAAKNLASLPNWVSVTEVFKTGSDIQILQKAGALSDMQSPEGIKRFERYSRPPQKAPCHQRLYLRGSCARAQHELRRGD